MVIKQIKLGEEVEITFEYIAGLFDGEGTVFISKTFSKDGKHKTPSYQLNIGIAMVNERVLKKIQKIFGGWLTIRRFKDQNKRNAFYWGLKSDKASLFLEKILPFLQIKKSQAELGIKYQKERYCPNKSENIKGKLVQLSIKEIKYREDTRIQMRNLNRLDSNKGGYNYEKTKY